MPEWSAFEAAQPQLAAHGRRLFYQFDPTTALGMLATVRSRDGGPRVHPVCPIIAVGGLWVFVVEMSPKFADLITDPRYALHCAPPPPPDEEFYVTGRARLVDDPAIRERVRADEGSGTLGAHPFERLFALEVDHILHTTWSNWGQPDTRPNYERWHAPS